MTKTKWLLYTVLIGLVPFLVRFLIFLVIKDIGAKYILNEIDMIAFGLVLNVSNITELEGNTTMDSRSKTINIGVSVFLVIFFTAFLGISYVSDLPNVNIFNKDSIKWLSLILSAGAFFFSYSIFKRLN
jgi:hypothetical protein